MQPHEDEETTASDVPSVSAEEIDSDEITEPTHGSTDDDSNEITEPTHCSTDYVVGSSLGISEDKPLADEGDDDSSTGEVDEQLLNVDDQTVNDDDSSIAEDDDLQVSDDDQPLAEDTDIPEDSNQQLEDCGNDITHDYDQPTENNDSRVPKEDDKLLDDYDNDIPKDGDQPLEVDDFNIPQDDHKQLEDTSLEDDDYNILEFDDQAIENTDNDDQPDNNNNRSLEDNYPDLAYDDDLQVENDAPFLMKVEEKPTNDFDVEPDKKPLETDPRIKDGPKRNEKAVTKNHLGHSSDTEDYESDLPVADEKLYEKPGQKSEDLQNKSTCDKRRDKHQLEEKLLPSSQRNRRARSSDKQPDGKENVPISATRSDNIKNKSDVDRDKENIKPTRKSRVDHNQNNKDPIISNALKETKPSTRRRYERPVRCRRSKPNENDIKQPELLLVEGFGMS